MRYICTSIVATLVLAGMSFADTINVPGDYPTIEQATAVASNGDTVLVAPGTWLETIQTWGKAITVEGSQGAALTIIDGEDVRGCVYMNGGEGNDTVIRGFTLTRGQRSQGGGMYCSGSAGPTVEDCIFRNNNAVDQNDARGGAIYAGSGNVVVRRCAFESNSAHEGGAAVFWSGNVTMEDCTFIGNSATYAGGVRQVLSFITFDNCTFQANSQHAVDLSASTPWHVTFTNCVFCANSPDHIDGSEWNDGGGNAFLDDCPDAGACCIEIQCYQYIEQQCLVAGGDWLGPKEDCEWADCGGAGEEGACCIDTSCTILSLDDCASAGGTFNGDGSTCDDVDCGGGGEEGMCCTNGGCVSTTESDCAYFLGTWIGSDTCDACPTSCIGDVNSDGEVAVNDILILIGNWGPCP